jgi:hypothetical protein
MDCVNHALLANCACELHDGELVMSSKEALVVNTEVTLAYTGSTGATNRKLLASSGFCLQGNPQDRIDLGLQDGFVDTQPQRGRMCVSACAVRYL